MEKDILVAAAITDAYVENVEAGLEATMQMVREAGHRNVDIICFPEMNITGYDPQGKTAASVGGFVQKTLMDAARQYRISILAGMAEKGVDRRVYASHLIATPDNRFTLYRKLHISPPEKSAFSAGRDIPVMDYLGLTFSVQLCYDAHFPEITGIMALKGAELVFIPHASPRKTPQEKYESWMRHLPARAYDNSLYIIAVNPFGQNRNGLSFPGLAVFIDPAGNVSKREFSDTSRLAIENISARKLENIRSNRMHYFLPQRNNALYAEYLRSHETEERKSSSKLTYQSDGGT